MPDVRWCHPSIHRASRLRGESKHLVGVRSRAVAPVATVRQTQGGPWGRGFSSHVPVVAQASRALRAARAFEACAGIHEENLSRPLLGRCRLPSHRLLLRSSTAGVVGRHPSYGGIAEGSEMGHHKNRDRVHSSAQHSRSAPGATIATTCRTAASRNCGTVVPHHLTSACSGLATLAADARR
jgi:hypothetical protein